MDQIDRKIVAELQNDGRISMTELAERIALSISATSERVKRLLESGIITGFGARLDPDLAGRSIQALVDVRFRPGAGPPDLGFDGPVFAGVVDAVHLTGPFDVQLRVMAADVSELDALLVRLKEDLAAEETNTRLILRTIEGFPRPLRPS